MMPHGLQRRQEIFDWEVIITAGVPKRLALCVSLRLRVARNGRVGFHPNKAPRRNRRLDLYPLLILLRHLRICVGGLLHHKRLRSPIMA